MANKSINQSIYNKKKSKIDDQGAEGSCPSKKAMILVWNHIRQSVEKVLIATGQNANGINLENTKIKGQLTWDDRWKGWKEEGTSSVLICHSQKKGDSPHSDRTKNRDSHILIKFTSK